MNDLLVNTKRTACACILAGLISACSTQRSKNGNYAEIDIATETGCTTPSVLFHTLRDKKSKSIDTTTMPLHVLPGTYLIGVSCGSVFRDDINACVKASDEQPDISVPAYPLVLDARKRYIFSCSMIKGLPELKLSESAF